jgi:hypothetical protein
VKVLFVYTGLPKGGIETFFVRMSKQLSMEGYEVRFLFFGNVFDFELINELQKVATVFKINDYLNVPSYFKRKSPLLKLLMPLKKRKLQNEVLNGITHIHAPDYNSILYANRILYKQTEIKLSTGIYHINEFNYDEQFKYIFGFYCNQFKMFKLNKKYTMKREGQDITVKQKERKRKSYCPQQRPGENYGGMHSAQQRKKGEKKA